MDILLSPLLNYVFYMLIMHAKFHANMMLFIIQFKVHYGSIFIKDKEIEHLLVVVVFNLQLF